MQKKTLIGLAGVLGVWLTAGLALPLVNTLKMFTPTQLMVFRGFMAAAMALIVLKGKIGKVDIYTKLIAIILPLATLGLYQGIRHWGAGPTIIMITATPIINVLFGYAIGRKTSIAGFVGLVLLLFGVTMAQWGGKFQWQGFGWSLWGMITNGILYELFFRAKSSSLQKGFYAFVGMGLLGILLSLDTSWEAARDPKLLLFLIGFAFVGGFLYWVANLVAFENLPTTEASILVQGETPAVIIGANLLLNEQLVLQQWIGVIIALIGAMYLSYQLTNTKK